jgi:two-component system, cell cycle sensor histidine kinase and response regulator CckA
MENEPFTRDVPTAHEHGGNTPDGPSRGAAGSPVNDHHLYHVIFDLVPDPMAITNLGNGWLIDVNQAFISWSGFSRDELLGHTTTELGFWTDDVQRKMILDRLREKGFAADEELTFKIKSGEARRIIFSGRLVEIAGQALFLSVAHDITGRKKAEDSLRISEAKYRSLFENAVEGIFQTTPGGRFISVNPALARICGFDDPLDLMRCFTDIGSQHYANPRDRDIFRQIVDERGMISGFETKLLKKDGSLVWVSINARAVRDPEGNVLHYEGTVNDITDRKNAEDALKEMRGLLEVAVEQSPSGILIADAPDVTIRIANSAALSIRGGDSQSLTDIAMEEHSLKWNAYRRDGTPMPPEELPLSRAVMKGEISHNEELIIRHENGEQRWVFANAAPVRGSDGNIRAGIVVFHDITDRKRAEQVLRENDIFLEEIQRIARLGGWKANPHTDYLEWTSGVYEALEIPAGYTPGLGEGLEFYEPEYIPVIQKEVAECLRTGRPFKVECIARTWSGGKIWAEVRGLAPVIEGMRSYVMGTFQNITERKNAEYEIMREREKLQTLSDNAPFGMALIDRAGNFTYINARFGEIFGYELSEICDGRSWFRLAYPDPAYRHSVVATWVEDMEGALPGERKPRVFTVSCKDGKQKIISFIPSLLASGDYLMTCEDITELKNLESQLLQAQKMEAIGTLAGGIAHDFNNILTSLMGYGSLLQLNMEATSPLRPYIEQIMIASSKAADLTKNLLAFSRQQPVRLAPLDINKAIKDSKKLLKRLLTEDIELRTSFAQDSAVAMADRSQIDQILFNLAANARDAMPRGGTLVIETDTVHLDEGFVRAYGFGEPGPHVLLRVCDSGQGMDKGTQEKIFDPFFTTKEIGKGTGLGLATVYGIVKQHAGHVTVDSVPGQGTVFSLYLPVSGKKTGEERSPSVSVRRGNETILIAEDDDGVRSFIREVLEQYGYTVVEAVDGDDAVHKFRDIRHFDLAILDSVMPGKNGREVLNEIKNEKPDIRACFISGYTKDVILDKGIEEKEYDFLAKPLTIDALLQKVREILDR